MASTVVDNLTPEQERALVGMLNEPTMGKAAEFAGVSHRTLNRWLDERGFSAAYRKARRESFKQAIGLAQKYAPVALNVLVTIAADPKAPHSARVAAAGNVLKFGRESLELDDIAARVEELEQAARAAKGTAA